MFRNIFDCDKDDSRNLLDKEERDLCEKATYRGVHVSNLSTSQLEPILHQYRDSIKVSTSWLNIGIATLTDHRLGAPA